MALILFAALSLTPTCTFDYISHCIIASLSFDARYTLVWSSCRGIALRTNLRRMCPCIKCPVKLRSEYVFGGLVQTSVVNDIHVAVFSCCFTFCSIRSRPSTLVDSLRNFVVICPFDMSFSHDVQCGLCPTGDWFRASRSTFYLHFLFYSCSPSSSATRFT